MTRFDRLRDSDATDVERLLLDSAAEDAPSARLRHRTLGTSLFPPGGSSNRPTVVSVVPAAIDSNGREEVSMMLHAVGRRAGAALAATGAVVALLGVTPSALAAQSAMVFTGGGSGPTAAIAIRRAFNDAATSASASGLYNCNQVGEPQLFSTPNDPFGRYFRAMVDVSCT